VTHSAVVTALWVLCVTPLPASSKRTGFVGGALFSGAVTGVGKQFWAGFPS